MAVSVADFLDNAGDDDLEMDENGGLTSKHMKSLENLYGKFEGYCKELAVFGFNSAGYDIKLIKKYLFKELCEHGQQPSFTVKKSGKYPCIKTEYFKGAVPCLPRELTTVREVIYKQCSHMRRSRDTCFNLCPCSSLGRPIYFSLGFSAHLFWLEMEELWITLRAL